jgi:hypothetical protein
VFAYSLAGELSPKREVVKKSWFSLVLVLGLAGCVPVETTATKLANDLKDNVYETSYKVKEWAMTPPADKLPPKEVANSYCYRVLQDILCYRQSMPGWENKLVAYQGTHAKPPAPATMQLIAKSKPNPATKAVNRVASAKPVFTENPDGTKVVIEAVEGITHEPLPDPSLAPEL